MIESIKPRNMLSSFKNYKGKRLSIKICLNAKLIINQTLIKDRSWVKIEWIIKHYTTKPFGAYKGIKNKTKTLK